MEAFLMVIYPPNNSRARFEQPKWANQTTEQQKWTQNTTSSLPSKFEESNDYDYRPSLEKSNSTIPGELIYTSQEIPESAVEAAQDKAQVKLIVADTEFMTTWQRVVQSQ